MSVRYKALNNDDSYRTPQKRHDICRRKRPSKTNRRSDIAEPWKYDWEAKEMDKKHHERFCQAVRHADGVVVRFCVDQLQNFALGRIEWTQYDGVMNRRRHLGLS